MLEGISKFKHVVNGLDTYVQASYLVNIASAIPTVDELTSREKQIITRNVAYGIGFVKSAVVSSGCGFITFSFNILNTVASTLLLEKLKKLNTINPVSLSILLSFLMELPKVLLGSDLVTTLISLVGVFAIGYYLNKKEKCIDVNFRNKVEKLNIIPKSGLSSSLFIGGVSVGLGINVFVAGIVVGIVCYLLGDKDKFVADVVKYVKLNGGTVGVNDVTKWLDNNVSKELVVYSGIVGIAFVVSGLLLSGIGISILSGVLVTGAVMDIINGVKYVRSVKRIERYKI